jgi:hypothetical protein
VRVALVAFFLLAGCTRTVPLEARFFPLMEIREVPDLPLAPGRGCTIYGTFLTASVAKIDADYPPGSVYREALFRHEQAHSIREFQDPLFLTKYALEPSFRLSEEKIGYAIELKWLRDHQGVFVPWDFALALADGYGGMISRDDAWEWVQQTLREP